LNTTCSLANKQLKINVWDGRLLLTKDDGFIENSLSGCSKSCVVIAVQVSGQYSTNSTSC